MDLARETLPHPSLIPILVDNEIQAWRFSVQDLCVEVMNRFGTELKFNFECTSALSEFYQTPAFRDRMAAFYSAHSGDDRLLPLLIYCDDFGLANGLPVPLP